jgi:hypothetical protein
LRRNFAVLFGQLGGQIPMFHIPGFFILFALYFLPTLVASGRHLPERGAIAVLNIFFGWTFIGWIVALIWAVAAPAPHIFYARPPYYPPRYW